MNHFKWQYPSRHSSVSGGSAEAGGRTEQNARPINQNSAMPVEPENDSSQAAGGAVEPDYITPRAVGEEGQNDTARSQSVLTEDSVGGERTEQQITDNIEQQNYDSLISRVETGRQQEGSTQQNGSEQQTQFDTDSERTDIQRDTGRSILQNDETFIYGQMQPQTSDDETMLPDGTIEQYLPDTNQNTNQSNNQYYNQNNSQYYNQNNNQYPDQYPDQNNSQYFSQNGSRYYNRNVNQNNNQYSDQSIGQYPNQNGNQNGSQYFGQSTNPNGYAGMPQSPARYNRGNMGRRGFWGGNRSGLAGMGQPQTGRSRANAPEYPTQGMTNQDQDMGGYSDTRAQGQGTGTPAEIDTPLDPSMSYNDFLQQNQRTGLLKIQAYGTNQSLPLDGVDVVISRSFSDGTKVFFRGTTDDSGIIDNISLPAPDSSLSQQSGSPVTSAAYRLDARLEGFAPIYYVVNIFDSVKTIQPIILRTLLR